MARVNDHYSLPYEGAPSEIPFIDYHSILQETSSRMANSQLVRAQSTRSNGTPSSGLRRPASRISKTNSAGNSPHGLERRKSSASHIVPRHISSLEDRCVRTLSSGRATIKRSKRPMIMERPTTWHSSSITSNLPGSTSTTFQNIADQSMIENRMPSCHPSEITGSLALATRVHLDCTVPMNPYGDLNASFEVEDQSGIPFDDQQSSFLDASGASYEANDFLDISSYPHMAPIQEPLTYRHPQRPAPDWTQLYPSDFSWTTTYPAPQDPSTQALPTRRRTPGAAVHPRLVKEQSKELVGMGLYDSPDKDQISSLVFGDDFGCPQRCSTLHGRQESGGKGLKLEETWQPPMGEEDEAEDEVEDEADEDYSTDEAEEEPFSGPNLIAAGQQQAALLPYGDLSNRTFFFDDEENLPNDMAFDQTFSFAQSKALDTTMEHATWL